MWGLISSFVLVEKRYSLSAKTQENSRTTPLAKPFGFLNLFKKMGVGPRIKVCNYFWWQTFLFQIFDVNLSLSWLLMIILFFMIVNDSLIREKINYHDC